MRYTKLEKKHLESTPFCPFPSNIPYATFSWTSDFNCNLWWKSNPME